MRLESEAHSHSPDEGGRMDQVCGVQTRPCRARCQLPVRQALPILARMPHMRRPASTRLHGCASLSTGDRDYYITTQIALRYAFLCGCSAPTAQERRMSPGARAQRRLQGLKMQAGGREFSDGPGMCRQGRGHLPPILSPSRLSQSHTTGVIKKQNGVQILFG